MTTTRRLTAAQAIVEYLKNQWVERDGESHAFFAGIFGILGHGNVAGLGEALEGTQDSFRLHQARNEQAMVHAAIAFAKRSNRLKAFACTSSIGPGATNMVTGAATATVNRIPVLLLPGDIFATRRVAPVLQQLEREDSQNVSVNDCFKPVSRYWDRIDRPEQLITALPSAMRVLTSPSETGAVTIALPQDVQAEAYDYPSHLFDRRVHSIPRQRPDRVALSRAASLIRSSSRPLIICGGGVIYSAAEAALDEFVKATGIPFGETQAGKGALPWNHPLNAGPIGSNGGLAANRLARDADLVIAIGTRLSDFTTASKTAFANTDVRFVGINVSSFDGAKQASLPLIGDARAALEELTLALASPVWHVSEEYQRSVQSFRDEWRSEVDRVRGLGGSTLMSQAAVIGIVNDAASAEDIVVCAAGGLPGDLLKLWRTERSGGYHLEYGYSCMGYEIAGGLGAKMAAPESEVFVMVGDGSYLMLSSEIATSIQEGVKLILVIVDNHGFGCIDRLSRMSGGDNSFNDFRFRTETGRLDGDVLPIDLAANAASVGALVVRASTRDELTEALAVARQETQTVAIVVEVDGSMSVPGYESWWDVPVAEVSDSPLVRSARDKYEVKRSTERWFV